MQAGIRACFFYNLWLLLISFSGGLFANGPGRPLPAPAFFDWLENSACEATVQELGEETVGLDLTYGANNPVLPPDLSGYTDDLRFVGALAGDAQTLVQGANNIINQYLENGNEVANFTQDQLASLPVGMRLNVGGVNIFIAMAEMRLKATHAEVDVFMRVEFPGLPEPLILGAFDVEFSRSGGFGDLRLELLSDYGIDVVPGKSRLLFYGAEIENGDNQPSQGTYAIITCGGLQELNLETTLLLSRDWAVPVRNGNTLVGEALNGLTTEGSESIDPALPMNQQRFARVHWNFSVNINPLSGDLLIQTGSQDTFAIARYPDIHLYASDIALDFSDFRNPAALTFPENYVSPYVIDGNALPCWRGIYIGSIALQTPERWRGANQEPLLAYGQSLIIDDRGFTGLLGVQNLLPLEEGNADGWAFSVDRLEVRLLQSQVERVEMDGLISVPFLAGAVVEGESPPDPEADVVPEDCLVYQAVVEPDGVYQLNTSVGNNYLVRIAPGSNLTIGAGSGIDLHYENETFLAAATLNGTVDFQTPAGLAGSSVLRAEGIQFEGLVLDNQNGIAETGIWSLNEGISADFGAFAILIDQTTLQENTESGEPEIVFAAHLEVGSGNTDLTVGGAFRILGHYNIDASSGRQSFFSDRFVVDAINIAASTSAFALSGTAAFYASHPIYGNGFYGAATLTLAAMEDASFGVAVQFGSIETATDSYRYFFADALVRFGATKPPVGGMFNLLGVGGTLWINMEDADGPPTGIPEPINENQASEAAEDYQQIGELASANNGDALSAFVGRTLSGRVMVPSRDVAFGIALSLVLATIAPNEEAMSINATFALEINATNGFNASIYGNATFFAPVNWDNQPPEEGFAALFDVTYVNDNLGGRLLATVDLYAKVKVLVGHQPGNLPPGPADPNMYEIPGAGYAGRIILFAHPAAGEWFLHVGNDQQKIGFRIAPGYFPLIDVAVEVAGYFMLGTSIGNLPDLPHYVTEIAGGSANFMRNENRFANGAGIAFGASLDLSVIARLLIFTAEVNAGLGFDLNLQQYYGAVCAETNNRIGINGWFAAGQAWAYLSGTVSMEFSVPFGGRVDFEILHAALATVLQVKGPNPFWGSGRVGGRYRLLGGIIRGNFRMDFTVGRQCTLVSGDGDGDVMANAPLIAFTLPDEGDQEVATDATILTGINFPLNEAMPFDASEYLLTLNSITLSDEQGEIPANLLSENGTYEVGFQPVDVLPGITTLTLEISLQLTNLTSGEVVREESRTVTFTTAPALKHIPPANVNASYPLDGMLNFFPDQHNEAYVHLQQGQPDLLSDGLIARFTRADNGDEDTEQANYNNSERRIFLALPTLENEQVYQFALLKLAAEGFGFVSPESSPGGGEGGPPLEPILLYDTLFTAYFQTSEFDNFDGLVWSSVHDETINNTSLEYVIPQGQEVFGTVENYGTEKHPPLIQWRVKEQFDWLDQTNLFPLLYDMLPGNWIFEGRSHPIVNTWRAPDELGSPFPYYGVAIASGAAPRITHASHFFAGNHDLSGLSDTLALPFLRMVKDDVNRYYQRMNELRDDFIGYMSNLGPGDPVDSNMNGDGGTGMGSGDGGGSTFTEEEIRMFIPSGIRQFLDYYEANSNLYNLTNPALHNNTSLYIIASYYLPGFPDIPIDTYQARIRTP